MQEFAALKLEIEELQKAIENGENQIEGAGQSLNDMKENLKKVTEEYEAKKVNFLFTAYSQPSS